jgi:tetratricopeptide (TPR) repeat protein
MSDDLLTIFRNRLHRGADPALAADLERTVAARREQRGGHADWGQLCEQAGLLNLAFREFQLALRDQPGNPTAAFRLAQHYRERGEASRAADLLEKLLQTDPACEDWLTLYIEVLGTDNAQPKARAALERAVRAGLPPERARILARTAADDEDNPAGDEELNPTDADCVRFQALFAGREDVHARQWAQGKQGGYSPVHEPLTPAVVRNHLLGNCTAGVYPIRLDGTCTIFAIDLDIDKSSLEQAQGRPELARSLRDALRQTAARLLAALRSLGFSPLFEDSGHKGRHFWVFLALPEPAEVLHRLGTYFLAWQAPQLPHGLHLEFFPKQASRKGQGLGNLIKLPLGIHRRTGRRALLLDDAGRPLAKPLAVLRSVVRLSRADLYAAGTRLKSLIPASAIPATGPAVPVTGPGEVSPAAGPPPPPPAPVWTEADFEADVRIRHLLGHCPVLAALKRTVEEHRRLDHEEQLVLIHTLGHLEGGPLAVNYLFGKCVDVGPEKYLKDRLKGNPVSCPSIRRKIAHITRRVACNCSFELAPDRYPTPVLHLLTLPADSPLPAALAPEDMATLARRFAALALRREEIQREYQDLHRAFLAALATSPERTVACPGGRYR